VCSRAKLRWPGSTVRLEVTAAVLTDVERQADELNRRAAELVED
jgi:hypothetical protein